MTYLMESKDEAKRLLMKSDADSTRSQLELTGLRPRMSAVDAGGGAGFVSWIMAQIVGEEGRVSLVDQSFERLDAAKNHIKPYSNVFFVQSDLREIPIATGSVDYVFCRFVFEYLDEPQAVFNELYRIVKPGGRLIVGDLDNNILTHYPLREELEHKLLQIVSEFKRLKLWDPYMGRRLYSFYRQSSMREITVHMLPHHLIYGEVKDPDYQNMKMKLDRVCELWQSGTIQLNFDPVSFQQEFMEFFKSPDRFSYTPLILIEGIKAIRV